MSDLRIVYCSARIKGASNPSGHQDQEVYLRALRAAAVIDVLELGTYVSRVATAPLATAGRNGRPRIVTSSWPLMVKDSAGGEVRDASYMVSIARREEKGSDVNVAAHLLADTFQGLVDRAVVISNDSDLRLPVDMARMQIPVGLVNPTRGYPAGALSGSPSSGAGSHWWYQLAASDYTTNQLPAHIPGTRLTRPPG